MAKKVGVYICQCGTNIAGKVDVEKIAAEIGEDSGVAVCRTYKYMWVWIMWSRPLVRPRCTSRPFATPAPRPA
jgi:hypothetical protein